MSYVIAAPEVMTATAADLAAIGSTLEAAHLATAAPTLAVTPAAADEVSTGIAQLFSQHAQDYQAQARQAAAFQEQFVAHLKTSAAAYSSIEDFIAWCLQATASNLAQITASLQQALSPFVDAFLNQVGPYILGILILSVFGGALLLGVVIEFIDLITSVITGQPFSVI